MLLRLHDCVGKGNQNVATNQQRFIQFDHAKNGNEFNSSRSDSALLNFIINSLSKDLF